ncbi:MAG: diguanylate cyclase domain-containing protein [Ramlibacter sp.]
MSAQELTVWSMTLGTIAALAIARTAQFARRPTMSHVQGIAYHLAVFLLVLILSGVAGHLAPSIPPRAVQVAQVLAGPLCVGLSDLWIRGWLYAPQRDRLMASALQWAAVLLPLGGLAALALPAPLQLPAATGLSVAGGSLTFWLTARAWLLGDRLAPLMSAGCLLTLPAIAGLYAITLQMPVMELLPMQIACALCAALSNALTGIGLWRRDRHEQRARREPPGTSGFDPVTQVRNGRGLVHQLVRAQRRRRRSGRDGALLAVMVFDLERLRTEAGSAGLNELFIGVAGRIQRQVGAVNVVGRYYEGCFVALVETIPSLTWLRTLSLRLASNLRRPLPVTLRCGDRSDLTLDVGVGVVHLSRPPDAVEDILAEAQRMALAARSMRFRAAIADQRSGQPVAIEQVQLAANRRRHAAVARAAS